MKFEQKYPDASPSDRFEFEYSFVTKTPTLGNCTLCDAFTKWIDVVFQVPVCSEECGGAMWAKYREDKEAPYNFDEHFDAVKEELKIAEECPAELSKDIIIVVRDQLPYLKECIESIRQHTKNFHLYIWDNASGPETVAYIEGLMRERRDNPDLDWDVSTMRYNQNVGFIRPNNELVGWGESEYIILLNSDCKVFEYWDRALIGFLRKNRDVWQTGCWGGHMGSDGRGFGGDYGYEIDYIPGWCFCISRDLFRRKILPRERCVVDGIEQGGVSFLSLQQEGLFDPRLKFAYCEDADLSLRLKEAGGKIYALHAPIVHHYQNKTIKVVKEEGEVDVKSSFADNHEYMRVRWKDYLETGRVLLSKDTPNGQV